MAVTPSRVKEGTLTLGGATPTDFSCPPTNIRITPTTDTEDAVESLCGDIIQGTGKTTWQLQGTSIQDFDGGGASFVLYCFDNDGDTVDFSWKPNAKPGVWTGQCVIQAVEIGGDVNTMLTTDFVFGIQGKPIRTP